VRIEYTAFVPNLARLISPSGQFLLFVEKIGRREIFMLTAIEKQQVVTDHRQSAKDVGSSEVQIALLTADIIKLTEHFKVNKHDLHSRLGLTNKVSKRRRLLKYLRAKNLSAYRALIGKLGLRESK
jgi:small subunit ribosomal protein S15